MLAIKDWAFVSYQENLQNTGITCTPLSKTEKKRTEFESYTYTLHCSFLEQTSNFSIEL